MLVVTFGEYNIWLFNGCRRKGVKGRKGFYHLNGSFLLLFLPYHQYHLMLLRVKNHNLQFKLVNKASYLCNILT